MNGQYPDFQWGAPEVVPVTDTKPRTSFLEIVLKTIVPAVATIALLFPQQPRIALLLAVVALMSLGMSVVPPLAKRIRTLTADRREHKAAAAAFSKLQKQIRAFEPLVSCQSGDNLHYIVLNRICGNNSSNYASLGLVPSQIFGELWGEITTRSAHPKPTYELLRDATREFNFLLANFCKYFVCPVYETVPAKLLAVLGNKQYATQVEADLVDYRERFLHFLNTYSAFLREVDESLPRPLNLGYYFARPKPIQGTASGAGA